MKRCPQCGREYDPSMMFCLDDGAELLYGPGSGDEPATAILTEPGRVATTEIFESPTRAQFRSKEAQPPNHLGSSTERQSLSAHRAVQPQEGGSHREQDGS